MKKICIIGAGGFGQAVMENLEANSYTPAFFADDFKKKPFFGIPMISIDNLKPNIHSVVLAIGDVTTRKKIISRLPDNIEIMTLIHPRALVSKRAHIGKGSVICAFATVRASVNLGDYSQISLYTTIGHDINTGKYFTTAPSVTLSGHTQIGNDVRFGANSCTLEGIKITDRVRIGAGSVITNDITEPGTYLGVPAILKGPYK